jgi:hypothetical protein
MAMTFEIEIDREEDGRWIAEVPDPQPRRLGRRVFAFHDDEEIGPKMLSRIAKKTGLTPDDL